MADPQATFSANMAAHGIDLSGDENAYVLPNDGRDHELANIMCANCGQGLQRLTDPGGAVSLIHERAWVNYDHDPEPIEVPAGGKKDLLCDFCGAQEQPYWHLKGARLIRQTGNLTQDHGGTWAACEGCGQLLQRNDLEALLDRAMQTDRGCNSEQLRQARLSALTDWLNYLATVDEMTYVGPRPGPAKLIWQMMPKLQAGLVKFWNNPTLKQGLCADRKAWPVPLPAFVCGGAGEPLVGDFTRLFPPGIEVPEPAWDAHVKHLTASVWGAELYWVSSQFTSLAIMAGKDFDSPWLSRDDLPSQAGFLIWEDSVGEIPRMDYALGGSAAFRGAHWTVIPDGIWVTFYAQVEDVDPDADVTVMRQNLGWLMCPNTGGGISFGEVDLHDTDFVTIRTFLATLFLLNQPGVAEVATAPVDKREARKYQRNHQRPQPPVRLINLRRQPTRTGHSGAEGPRGPIDYRVYRKGHWKQQPYGPKRGLRRPIYVSGYIAGPDGAPLRASRPDVKVLK